MRKNLESHGIQRVFGDAVWQCSFGSCMVKAAFQLHESERGGKTHERGACRKHALGWAHGCDGCTKLIYEKMPENHGLLEGK